MRQMFNAMTEIASLDVIYEWVTQIDDVTLEIKRDVVFDSEFLKLTNQEVEKKGKGGLQRSFCAFSYKSEKYEKQKTQNCLSVI